MPGFVFVDKGIVGVGLVATVVGYFAGEPEDFF